MKTDNRTIRKPLVIGGRYGRLCATSGPTKTHGRYAYVFRCDCGNVIEKPSIYIRRSSVPSCGCYASERKSENGKRNRRHGLAIEGTQARRLYDVYRQMLRRCHDENSKDFPAWGARGISVCDEWRRDIHAFFDWAYANGYRKGVTIERRDNNGNYEPGNCEWIANELQARNTRKIRSLEYRGKSQSIADWARETGIKRTTIASRLRYGFSIDRVLTP